MKKLGLLSVAAAVALMSGSAFAGEVKLTADAQVTGESLKVEAANSEANEYYKEKVNLYLDMKNDDGITMKAGYSLYDGQMNGSVPSTNSGVNPSLAYGYVIAPLGDITLKSGLVEAGPFGTNFTNSGNSAFKPFALDYKMNGLNVGFEEIMVTESNSYNKNGGMILAAGDGDKSASRVYVKGKAGDLAWGVRDTITQTGKTATADKKSDSQIEAYAAGMAAGMNVAVHYATQSGDSYSDSTMGLYAHALMPMGNLTAGVAIANLTNGFTTGAEFDPSTLTDKVLDSLSSYKSEPTSLVVIPVIYKVNDKITVDGRLVSGKLNTAPVSAALNGTKISAEQAASTSEGYTETDVNLNYALGAVTNIKLSYAAGSGKAVGDKSVTYMGWALTTAF